MRSANLLQINTIPATAPSRDLLRRIIEHEKDGMPLVITGVDGNSHWDSQFSPVLGDNTPVDRRTGTVWNSSKPLVQPFKPHCYS